MQRSWMGLLKVEVEIGRSERRDAISGNHEKKRLIGKALAAEPLGERKASLRAQDEKGRGKDVRHEPRGRDRCRRAEVKSRVTGVRIEQVADAQAVGCQAPFGVA